MPSVVSGTTQEEIIAQRQEKVGNGGDIDLSTGSTTTMEAVGGDGKSIIVGGYGPKSGNTHSVCSGYSVESKFSNSFSSLPSPYSLSHYVSFSLFSGSTSYSGDTAHLEGDFPVNNPRFQPNTQCTGNTQILKSLTPVLSPHYNVIDDSGSSVWLSEEYVTFSGDSSFSFATKYIHNPSSICIPNKIKRILDLYVSIEDLKRVHPDIDTAKELVLIAASNFSMTHIEREKRLHWEVLNRQLSDNSTRRYRAALDILLKGTKQKGPIIEVVKKHSEGNFATTYQLTDTYWRKGTMNYQLKTQYAIDLSFKNYLEMILVAGKSPIAKHYLTNLHRVQMPSREQVFERGKELCKQGYSKGGKRMIHLNKRSLEKLVPDPKEREKVVPLEIHMELYERLFRFNENGTYEHCIPVVCSEKAGHRVITSIDMCPSWIRDMILLDGEPVSEVDYAALHPNIAMKLYAGKKRYITHDGVAKESGVEKEKVKKAHLSLFNLSNRDRFKNELFNYYETYEPEMMRAMRIDKEQNGDKITSTRMFLIETKMMSEVISILDRKGIPCYYLFDCVGVPKSKRDVAIKVMNEVAQRNGIYTTAK